MIRDSTMNKIFSPQNWDASPGKHNLIESANQPAQRTQKQQSCFLDQVVECLHESSCIGKALCAISPNVVRMKDEILLKTPPGYARHMCQFFNQLPASRTLQHTYLTKCPSSSTNKTRTQPGTRPASPWHPTRIPYIQRINQSNHNNSTSYFPLFHCPLPSMTVATSLEPNAAWPRPLQTCSTA